VPKKNAYGGKLRRGQKGYSKEVTLVKGLKPQGISIGAWFAVPWIVMTKVEHTVECWLDNLTYVFDHCCNGELLLFLPVKQHTGRTRTYRLSMREAGIDTHQRSDWTKLKSLRINPGITMEEKLTENDK
jgi:hypothetical protein